MRTLGFIIAFFGWLMSMNGYTTQHVLMIVVGFVLVAGSYYLERR
jgi:hypothetical protein